MRIIHRDIDGKDLSGQIKVQAEEPEDMYHLYNIIAEGDSIRASTVRNVTREGSTGSTSKSRVHMTLTIRVESIVFDSEQCSLRTSGRNIEESEHVKLGQYHTIEIEISMPFTIEKPCWDQIYMDRIDLATDPSKKADIAAVVMHEGLCHLCLLTSAMTITRSRIERRMPKKKQGDSLYSKARAKFFEEIYEAIKTHINFSLVKVVLLGSPGFLKDDFMNYLNETAVRKGDSDLIHNKSKFLKSHTSSGHKKSIEEMLGDSNLKSQLVDVKAADEMRALEGFYTALSNDPDRACYGYPSVLTADALLAVETLLVTDKLFKAADFTKRKDYVNLVDSVKNHGGLVYVFSSMHVSGEQLDKFTGVAATLRFPCPDVDDGNGNSNGNSNSNSNGNGNGTNQGDDILSSDSDVSSDDDIFSSRKKSGGNVAAIQDMGLV